MFVRFSSDLSTFSPNLSITNYDFARRVAPELRRSIETTLKPFLSFTTPFFRVWKKPQAVAVIKQDLQWVLQKVIVADSAGKKFWIFDQTKSFEENLKTFLSCLALKLNYSSKENLDAILDGLLAEYVEFRQNFFFKIFLFDPNSDFCF